MAGSHLESVFAIKNSGGLLQCSIFGLNEEEPQEHEFKSQPANIDKLNFKSVCQIVTQMCEVLT